MTNTNPAKKAQLSIIVVGRGGKMRICRMRPDIPSAKASNSMLDVPAGLTLRQAVMQAVADEITKASEAFAKRGVPVNMEIFTIGQVAIKYYQMVPFLKGGNYMTTEDIEAISSERDNAEDKGSYADLAGAIAKAIAQGNGVHLQASGNAALLELIVPEGVTQIGRTAFYHCEALTSLVLPGGVTTIGPCAFEGCKSLKTLDMPEKLTVIENNTFSQCKSLVYLALPDGITEIGNTAFFGCDHVSYIVIPDSVTAIGEDAFSVVSPNGGWVANPGVVIVAGEGSFARQYCVDKGLQYASALPADIADLPGEP